MTALAVERTPDGLDDGHLAQRHLAGDPQAFGALVDRYQTRLLNFIDRTIGNRERAEDLVQEGFIRVFRRLRRFDGTQRFSSWIYTIASNLAENEITPQRANSFDSRRRRGHTHESLARFSSRRAMFPTSPD